MPSLQIFVRGAVVPLAHILWRLQQGQTPPFKALIKAHCPWGCLAGEFIMQVPAEPPMPAVARCCLCRRELRVDAARIATDSP